MSNEQIKLKLQEICKAYEDILGLVILFGSYSRNEANDNSDIDLYIEPRDATMTTSRLWRNKRYREFQNCLFDSFAQELDLLAYGGKRDLASMRRTPLWKQIESDGITIYDQRTKTVRL